MYQVKEGDAAVWAGLIFPLSSEDTSVAFWSPPTEANICLYSFLMRHYVAITDQLVDNCISLWCWAGNMYVLSELFAGHKTKTMTKTLKALS